MPRVLVHKTPLQQQAPTITPPPAESPKRDLLLEGLIQLGDLSPPKRAIDTSGASPGAPMRTPAHAQSARTMSAHDAVQRASAGPPRRCASVSSLPSPLLLLHSAQTRGRVGADSSYDAVAAIIAGPERGAGRGGGHNVGNEPSASEENVQHDAAAVRECAECQKSQQVLLKMSVPLHRLWEFSHPVSRNPAVFSPAHKHATHHRGRMRCLRSLARTSMPRTNAPARSRRCQIEHAIERKNCETRETDDVWCTHERAGVSSGYGLLHRPLPICVAIRSC